jgi:hypothetical protein
VSEKKKSSFIIIIASGSLASKGATAIRGMIAVISPQPVFKAAWAHKMAAPGVGASPAIISA